MNLIGYMVYVTKEHCSPGQTAREIIWIDGFTDEDGNVSSGLNLLINHIIESKSFRNGKLVSITPIFSGATIFSEKK
jgi:hypothetical protein